MEELQNKLGIRVGETDPTGMFTIQQMECLGACDRAPVMMVNNDHWHERLQPEQVGGLVDRMKTDGIKALSDCYLCEQRIGEGQTTTTPSKAKALPDYEPVLTKFAFTPGGAELDHYVKNQNGYQGLKKALTMTPDAVIEDVKKSGLARPRRRRLPDRAQVAVRRQEIAEAEIHRLQRGRKRAGHLQGSPLDGAQSSPAGGGLPDRLLRNRLEGRLHLHPRGVLSPLPDDAEGDRRRAQGGIPRQEHPGLRLRLRGLPASRRRRL